MPADRMQKSILFRHIHSSLPCIQPDAPLYFRQILLHLHPARGDTVFFLVHRRDNLEAGFYTLYIVTQNKETYLTYIYIDLEQ